VTILTRDDVTSCAPFFLRIDVNAFLIYGQEVSIDKWWSRSSCWHRSSVFYHRLRKVTGTLRAELSRDLKCTCYPLTSCVPLHPPCHVNHVWNFAKDSSTAIPSDVSSGFFYKARSQFRIASNMHLQFADRNFKAAAQHWSTSKPIQKVGFECAVRA
jgi:hypothetical protein